MRRLVPRLPMDQPVRVSSNSRRPRGSEECDEEGTDDGCDDNDATSWEWAFSAAAASSEGSPSSGSLRYRAARMSVVATPHPATQTIITGKPRMSVSLLTKGNSGVKTRAMTGSRIHA